MVARRLVVLFGLWLLVAPLLAEELHIRVYHPIMQLAGTMDSITLYQGDEIELMITLEDGTGEVVPDHPVEVRSDQLNPLEASASASDARGVVTVVYRAESLGEEVLHIQAGAASLELPVAVLDVTELAANIHPEAQLVEDVPGVVSWHTLGRVGYSDAGTPRFHESILELQGQQVTLQGFIMPLESGIRHSHFLLSAISPSCPFCATAGPEMLAEVKMRGNSTIEFSYNPVFVRGRLEVLRNDPLGMLYRLTDAVQQRL